MTAQIGILISAETALFAPHHVEAALLLVGDVHLVVIRSGGGDGGLGPQDLTTTQMNHCSCPLNL